jgi:large repetitive protein
MLRITGNKGQLFIAVGSNTNGGIPGELSSSRIMKDNFFSSAILVANLGVPNFNGVLQYSAPIDGNPTAGYGPNGVEIFAPGLRNPYGIVVHSNEELYATDNGESFLRTLSVDVLVHPTM